MRFICNALWQSLNSQWLTHALLVLLVVCAFWSVILTLIRIGELTQVEVIEEPGNRTFIHYSPSFWQAFIEVDPVARTMRSFVQIITCAK